jgi:hypothetical protein
MREFCGDPLLSFHNAGVGGSNPPVDTIFIFKNNKLNNFSGS